jgi:hypothetical protein
VQCGVLAIGARWREHHLDASEVSGPASFEDAAPDGPDGVIERNIEPAGAGRSDQLLAQRPGCGVRRGGDR